MSKMLDLAYFQVEKGNLQPDIITFNAASWVMSRIRIQVAEPKILAAFRRVVQGHMGMSVHHTVALTAHLHTK